MKSIVCGAGVVGQSIAESLSKEDLEVTVIDESAEAIKKISNTLDVKAIVGAASSPSVLESAGARNCDILIAVTKSDETNMIACQIGYSDWRRTMFPCSRNPIWMNIDLSWRKDKHYFIFVHCMSVIVTHDHIFQKK